MWLTAILIIVALIALLGLVPVRLQADVYHGERSAALIRVMAPGLEKEWRLTLVSGAEGRRLAQVDPSGAIHPLSPSGSASHLARLLAKRLKQSSRARRFLLAHVRLDALHGLVRIHSDNAARSALLTGFLRSLLPLLSPGWRQATRIRIVPDFFGNTSSLQARCIVRLRAGTILITLAILTAEALCQRIAQAREAA